MALLQSWIDGDDTEDQRETGEYLVRVLDEDRLSERKFFLRNLKTSHGKPCRPAGYRPAGVGDQPQAFAGQHGLCPVAAGVVAANMQVIIPEIADYEVRRELLRANKFRANCAARCSDAARGVPPDHNGGDAQSR